MTRAAWVMWAGVLIWAWGCDCSGPHQAGGPCAGPRPPDTCDVPCSDEEPCEGSFYCAAGGVCTADCDPLRPAEGCPGGRCMNDGRCMPSNRPDGDLDATGVCADGNSSDPVPGMCPLVEWVGPALDNHGAIQTVYGPADPIDETPTGASIDAVLDLLAMTPDPSEDPTIFILATDGEPDTCAQPNPQEGQPEALAAAERAYRTGIRTFVISVGEGVVSERHLQDMANAGLGRGAGDPDAEFWVAGDDEGLRTALTDIIGGELSCVVTLEGRIQSLEDACAGTVRLNGEALSCDDPNGWRVIDETHIALTGDASDTLQSGPGVTPEASVPCHVILI